MMNSIWRKMMYIEQTFGKQKMIHNETEYIEAVENAESTQELNALRESGVNIRSKKGLKLWQEKYWDFKKCPECAKRKYKIEPIPDSIGDIYKELKKRNLQAQKKV